MEKKWLVVEVHEFHTDKETAEHRCYILNTLFPDKRLKTIEITTESQNVDPQPKSDRIEFPIGV
jgi:hypothetical protein